MWPRALKPHERLLINYLTPGGSPPGTLDSTLVIELDDGGMGSIAVPHTKKTIRTADCAFYDIDGLPVIVDLFLGQEGEFLELEFWRVDYGPTQRFPTSQTELLDKLQLQHPTHN